MERGRPQITVAKRMRFPRTRYPIFLAFDDQHASGSSAPSILRRGQTKKAGPITLA